MMPWFIWMDQGFTLVVNAGPIWQVMMKSSPRVFMEVMDEPISLTCASMSTSVQQKTEDSSRAFTVSVTFIANDATHSLVGRMQEHTNHHKSTRRANSSLKRFIYSWRRVIGIKSIIQQENEGINGKFDPWVGEKEEEDKEEEEQDEMPIRKMEVVRFMSTDQERGLGLEHRLLLWDLLHRRRGVLL